MENPGPLMGRRYGETGPWVVALHGGPAAAGNAAPIAEGLADRFRCLEPWQRASEPGEAEPLTVARHVADLHAVIMEQCADGPVAVIGESWGAMLALAYAAAHPGSATAIVLVGCGTFDPVSRARLQETLAAREPAAAYDFDPIRSQDEQMREITFDPVAHAQSWDDMIRLQEDGAYPAAFASITSPVLMVHGDYDPHPGAMIRDSLLPHVPQLEYIELARCGHSPWNERYAREEFFAVVGWWLGEWLA